MANGKQKWVSDLIGNDYRNWFNEIVLLACGTGRGKTTFALDIYSRFLLKEKKEVIYLCNRSSLKNQVRNDIEIYGLKDITCISYQKFTKMIMSGDDIPEYNVYICDEAHYFLSDSEFNLYTDVIYDYLMARKSNATLLFMTATYKNIFSKIERDLEKQLRKPAIKYYLPTDYNMEEIY